MKGSILLQFLFVSVYVWLFAGQMALAQVPSSDLDSIVQDAYERMQQRKAAEQRGLVIDYCSLRDMVYPIFVEPDYGETKVLYTVADVPSPKGKGLIGYISDPNDYLDVVAEQRINELLYELEQKSSVEVAVVMLPSIGEAISKNFAVDLFESWGIGKADTDNGMLMLTVMDQRRTEFEVGYGLESILTDVVCYRIGVNEIVPNFKVGAYGQGIQDAIVRIKEFLENPGNR